LIGPQSSGIVHEKACHLGNVSLGDFLNPIGAAIDNFVGNQVNAARGWFGLDPIDLNDARYDQNPEIPEHILNTTEFERNSEAGGYSVPQTGDNEEPTGATNHCGSDGTPNGTSFPGGDNVESNDWSTHDNRPILLDLDGNGLQVTELNNSSVFFDSTDDGLQNRTAWAAAGDGVLFIDVNGDGTITEARQFVFTEWDPTAGSDIEALASVFDTNGDGVFDANDDRFHEFMVMVTQPNGSQLAYALDDPTINITFTYCKWNNILRH
jgi:hypothetical protein